MPSRKPRNFGCALINACPRALSASTMAFSAIGAVFGFIAAIVEARLGLLAASCATAAGILILIVKVLVGLISATYCAPVPLSAVTVAFVTLISSEEKPLTASENVTVTEKDVSTL